MLGLAGLILVGDSSDSLYQPYYQYSPHPNILSYTQYTQPSSWKVPFQGSFCPATKAGSPNWDWSPLQTNSSQHREGPTFISYGHLKQCL